MWGVRTHGLMNQCFSLPADDYVEENGFNPHREKLEPIIPQQISRGSIQGLCLWRKNKGEPITFTTLQVEYCSALRWCDWWWRWWWRWQWLVGQGGAHSSPNNAIMITLPHELWGSGMTTLHDTSCFNLVSLCKPHESSNVLCLKDFDKFYEST